MLSETLTDEEIARQKEIVIARKYHEGDQGVKLTDRLLQFINNNIPFNMNVCSSVIEAVAERLKVTGFDSDNPTVLEWAWTSWKKNKLLARQEEIYANALRDGEHFVIVSWDPEEMRVVFSPHPRYISESNEGDGYGCWIKYTENDYHQKPEYGVKQWYEVDDNNMKLYHKNMYFPDRIEKYISDEFSTEWSLVSTEPWVDAEGVPLGIAVVAFNNEGLRCEAKSAIPLQDALNKTLVDLLTASDLTAFRIYYALGFIPTSDGKPPAQDSSNLLEIEPGIVVATTKARRDAEFGSIEPAQISPLMDLAHQMVLWIAMVTKTPISRFISTRLVASDDTLKEQETPLISRVHARQYSFSDSWIECFNLGAKLFNMFGMEVALPEGSITPIWAEAAARGEAEKLSILKDKQSIGIPEEQLWIELGYDSVTIERMKKMKQEAIDAAKSAISGDGDNGSSSGNGDNGNGDTDNGTGSGGTASTDREPADTTSEG